MPSERDTLAHYARIRALIARHGWAITYDGTPRGRGPHGYTIGLAEHGLPELIVFGLPGATTENLLNNMGRLMIARGALPVGVQHDGFITGAPLTLVEVADSEVHLPVANAFYRLDRPVVAHQVLYPDERGLFPWQSGSLLADMPLLGVHSDALRSRPLR